MTIEVRQMVIKSTVGDDHGSHEQHQPDAPQSDMERLRAEILAECRELMVLTLRDSLER